MIKFLLSVLLAATMVFNVGCGLMHNSKEHPSAEHPKAEQPAAEDAKVEHSYLNWDKVSHRFSWEIGDDLYMTVKDLDLCIKIYNEGLEIEDVEYLDVAWCSVCGTVLLPDEEAYTDHKTGEALCGYHSIFDEELNMYVKYTE